jgi:VCBS repeat-containing protein
VNIFVLYPYQRCSRVQELQMTTVVEDNVFVVACDGTSDELDVPIKRAFDDRVFKKVHHTITTALHHRICFCC